LIILENEKIGKKESFIFGKSFVEKENEKLSKYISKPASVLQMDLGKPDEDFKNAKGNFEFIYNTKKYGIPCERRFEINSENIVIGFVSNGCF